MNKPKNLIFPTRGLADDGFCVYTGDSCSTGQANSVMWFSHNDSAAARGLSRNRNSTDAEKCPKPVYL